MRRQSKCSKKGDTDVKNDAHCFSPADARRLYGTIKEVKTQVDAVFTAESMEREVQLPDLLRERVGQLFRSQDAIALHMLADAPGLNLKTAWGVQQFFTRAEGALSMYAGQ
jgi:hypothetical protein